MERLTENFLGCYQIKGCDNFTCEEICNNVLNCGYCPISEAINKLAEYEDLEEQGLLLRLPCYIGDSIYSVIEDGLTIFELKFSLDFYARRKNDFGKTVFLTKAEAEQKLKEMESD